MKQAAAKAFISSILLHSLSTWHKTLLALNSKLLNTMIWIIEVSEEVILAAPFYLFVYMRYRFFLFFCIGRKYFL